MRWLKLLVGGGGRVQKRALTHRQFGKGFRDEFLNPRIRSRTLRRRSSNVLRSRSSSSWSWSYHSGGTCWAMGHSKLSEKFSIRLIQGSNDSQPVTLA